MRRLAKLADQYLFGKKMTTYNPNDIQISGLYTDAHVSSTSTSVYANGKMQVLVFPSCNYYPSGTGYQSEPPIVQYIYENTEIYVLDDSGMMSLLTWEKSKISNEFLHNAGSSSLMVGAEKHGEASIKSQVGTSRISDLRVPMYFTVPSGIVPKTYKWVARLNGVTTNKKVPVTVNVSNFSVSASDFVIQDYLRQGNCTMKIIKYTHSRIPATQLLVKCIDYKGCIFGSGGSCWIALMKDHVCGVFLIHPNSYNLVAYCNKKYENWNYTLKGVSLSKSGQTLMTSDNSWDEIVDQRDVEIGWTHGVVMKRIHSSNLSIINKGNGDRSESWVAGGFKVQDNFGNAVLFDIDFDESSGGSWAVTNPVVQIT